MLVHYCSYHLLLNWLLFHVRLNMYIITVSYSNVDNEISSLILNFIYKYVYFVLFNNLCM